MHRQNKFQIFIDKLRGKKPTLKKIKEKNTILISNQHIKKVILNIDGENNIVEISNNIEIQDLIKIRIYGNNNIIKIDENCEINFLNISLGMKHSNFGKVCNSVFSIGKKTSIGEVEYNTFNSNTKCKIGNNCMFAFGILIYNTDAHPIFDIETKQIINKVREIIISDNCWIGARTTILKNTQIAKNNIVGWGSIVSGKHLSPNTIIAGNPAKKVREGITWEANGAIYGYIENNLTESSNASK